MILSIGVWNVPQPRTRSIEGSLATGIKPESIGKLWRYEEGNEVGI
jgi:hypothetical protein